MDNTTAPIGSGAAKKAAGVTFRPQVDVLEFEEASSFVCGKKRYTTLAGIGGIILLALSIFEFVSLSDEWKLHCPSWPMQVKYVVFGNAIVTCTATLAIFGRLVVLLPCIKSKRKGTVAKILHSPRAALGASHRGILQKRNRSPPPPQGSGDRPVLGAAGAAAAVIMGRTTSSNAIGGSPEHQSAVSFGLSPTHSPTLTTPAPSVINPLHQRGSASSSEDDQPGPATNGACLNGNSNGSSYIQGAATSYQTRSAHTSTPPPEPAPDILNDCELELYPTCSSPPPPLTPFQSSALSAGGENQHLSNNSHNAQTPSSPPQAQIQTHSNPENNSTPASTSAVNLIVRSSPAVQPRHIATSPDYVPHTPQASAEPSTPPDINEAILKEEREPTTNNSTGSASTAKLSPPPSRGVQPSPKTVRKQVTVSFDKTDGSPMKKEPTSDSNLTGHGLTASSGSGNSIGSVGSGEIDRTNFTETTGKRSNSDKVKLTGNSYMPTGGDNSAPSGPSIIDVDAEEEEEDGGFAPNKLSSLPMGIRFRDKNTTFRRLTLPMSGMGLGGAATLLGRRNSKPWYHWPIRILWLLLHLWGLLGSYAIVDMQKKCQASGIQTLDVAAIFFVVLFICTCIGEVFLVLRVQFNR